MEPASGRHYRVLCIAGAGQSPALRGFCGEPAGGRHYRGAATLAVSCRSLLK